LSKGALIFLGHWQFNKKNGFGIRIISKNCMYRGEYMNDKKHGRGKLVFEDKRELEANFVEGEIDEENVTIRYPNKVIFKGEIKNM